MATGLQSWLVDEENFISESLPDTEAVEMRQAVEVCVLYSAA
jgi:hypothetical protein